MKVYIAGPMTGIKDNNFPAFYDKERELSGMSFFSAIVNPASLPHGKDDSWNTIMKRDIAELIKCDAVMFLKGWEESRGARLERQIAEGLGLEIYEEQAVK